MGLVAAAGLLATAGVLDALHLWHEPVARLGVWSVPRALAAGWCGVLVGLPIALVAGWRGRSLQWATAGLFAAFAGVNAWLLWTGAASCGCFGSLAVPPGVTMTADLVVAALLAAGAPPRTVSSRLAPCIAVLVAVGVTLVLGIRSPGLPTPTIAQDDPLAGQLLHGEHILVFHRRDCPHCIADLPSWLDMADADRSFGRTTWIFVDVDKQPQLSPHQLRGHPVLHRPDPRLITPLIQLWRDGRLVASGTKPSAMP